jgi:hypothetical protein
MPQSLTLHYQAKRIIKNSSGIYLKEMQEIDYLQGAAEKARQNKSEETKQSSDQTQL